MSTIDDFTSNGPISLSSDQTLSDLNQSNEQSKPDYLTTVYIVNSIVIPNLRLLLGNVINAINASVPNKDQNKAITHIVRQSFDEMYFDVLRKAYPDCNFEQDGTYAVSPSMKRSEVFATLKT